MLTKQKLAYIKKKEKDYDNRSTRAGEDADINTQEDNEGSWSTAQMDNNNDTGEEQTQYDIH